MKTAFIICMVCILSMCIAVAGYCIGYCHTLNRIQITDAEEGIVEITDQFGEAWVYSYE